MVTDPLAAWWVHSVVVRRHTGVGPDGDLYATPVTIIGFIDDDTRLVAGATGEQLTAAGAFIAPAGTPHIPPRSLLTRPDGRDVRVLTFADNAPPVPGLPGHVEATFV